MVAQSVMLDDLRRQSGAQLLRMTDEFGFGALGAAWVHDAEASRWWYLLVSPMIDTKGPRWVYDRLIRIFQKLALPEGITPLDIRIASPHEQDWRAIATSMGVNGGEVEIRSSEIGGVRIDRMLAYRILRGDNMHRRRERVFDTRYRELMRAA